jgi:hypothetical protein
VARSRARYHFANEAPGWRYRDLIFDLEPEAERELDLAELNPIRGPVALMQYWDLGDLPGARWRLLRLAFLHLEQSDPARALPILAQIDIDHQPRGEQARLLLALATCLAAFDLRDPARLLLHESRAARRYIIRHDRRLPLEWWDARISLHLGDFQDAIPRLDAVRNACLQGRDWTRICRSSVDLVLAYARSGRRRAKRRPDAFGDLLGQLEDLEQLVDDGWGLSEKERAELVAALRAASGILLYYGLPEATSCDRALQVVLATRPVNLNRRLTLDFLPPVDLARIGSSYPGKEVPHPSAPRKAMPVELYALPGHGARYCAGLERKRPGSERPDCSALGVAGETPVPGGRGRPAGVALPSKLRGSRGWIIAGEGKPSLAIRRGRELGRLGRLLVRRLVVVGKGYGIDSRPKVATTGRGLPLFGSALRPGPSPSHDRKEHKATYQRSCYEVLDKRFVHLLAQPL